MTNYGLRQNHRKIIGKTKKSASVYLILWYRADGVPMAGIGGLQLKAPDETRMRVHAESWQSRDLGWLFLMLSKHYHVVYLEHSIIKPLFC
jgi:hypothetical protein